MPGVTEVEPDVETVETLDPPHRVIIHNDDATPMDYVVAVLRTEFDRPEADAVRIMWEAHTTGAAHVMTCGRDEAERRVGRAHSRARAAGWPLSFSIEADG
jgi:ATP-dependent Clp protease adaptor protein ClpS